MTRISWIWPQMEPFNPSAPHEWFLANDKTTRKLLFRKKHFGNHWFLIDFEVQDLYIFYRGKIGTQVGLTIKVLITNMTHI